MIYPEEQRYRNEVSDLEENADLLAHMLTRIRRDDVLEALNHGKIESDTAYRVALRTLRDDIDASLVIRFLASVLIEHLREKSNERRGKQ